MIHILLLYILLNITLSFRGPHHPKSSISHHHYAPQGEVKLTQDDELLHDTSHLKEDLGLLADQLDISNMTKQELEFHYFKLHDIDNDMKLDGLEILHAIQHTLHYHVEENTINYELIDKPVADDHLFWIVELIDKVLEEDDLDNDGFLGYVEFVHSRNKDIHEQNKNIW